MCAPGRTGAARRQPLYRWLQTQPATVDCARPAIPRRHLVQHTLPAVNTGVTQGPQPGTPPKYAYNDGDGSTAYDVEYPVQMPGFDPTFRLSA